MATTTLELPCISADDRKELWASSAAVDGEGPRTTERGC